MISRAVRLPAYGLRLAIQRPFCDKANKYGVTFDEEQIKAKMKQLKNRQNEEKVKKKPNQEFMKNYTIKKEKSKALKFREETNTEGIMNFQDLSLDEKPTYTLRHIFRVVQVTSYGEDFIQVDAFPYPPSVILTPNQVLLWEIENPYQMTTSSIKLMEMITPPPQYIIIGVNHPQKIPQQIHDYLRDLGINHDIIQVFECISNFNNYSSNDVNVMAFLYTGNPS